MAALRSAIPTDQLCLHYQPIVDMASGRISGMEALLRWNHPHLGAIEPAQFIPIAEQSGLIAGLGTWVLRRACADLRDWIDRGLSVPPVSINISALQFRDYRLVREVQDTLDQFKLAPSVLCIELTEGCVIEDVPFSETQLRALKGLGVALALDDFGTGYSSLSYLKHFPFDRVKIDKSFVVGVADSSQDAVIVEVVIAMAHGLGMLVVAEGVETLDQYSFLRARSCDSYQGHLFSRAVHKPAFEALLLAGSQRG